MKASFFGAFLLVLAGCTDDGPTPVASNVPVTADAGPKAAPLVRLASVTGPVTLTRKETSGPASVGPLLSGDVVETAAGGSATVRFSDGREVDIGPEGRFELSDEASGLVLSVGQGLVISRVSAAKGEQLQLTIRTPYGLVRLGQSEARIDVGADSAAVDVVTGELQIVSRTGSERQSKAGESATLTPTEVQARPREVRLAPLLIVLKAQTGRVELKKKGAPRFEPIVPGAVLETGDAIRVRQGAARLTVGPAQINVGANSELELGNAQPDESAALDLRQGTVDVAVPTGRTSRFQIGEGYALSVSDGAQFTLTRGKNGFELETLVGTVGVEHQGMQTVSAPSAHLSSLAFDGKAATTAVPQASLALPAKMGQNVFQPASGHVALTWPSTGGSVRVVVDRSPSFDSPFIDGMVSEAFVNVVLPVRGALFWKVMDGEVEHAKGSVRSAPERALRELSRVRNEVMDGAEKTAIYYQDKPPAVTFFWKSASEHPNVEYRLKVFREGDFTAPIEDRVTRGTNAQLPEQALSEGTYFWSVTPLDEKGQPLEGGRMNKLEMVYDNAVSEVIIRSPKNGDAAAAKVLAMGIAPVGARVSANGQVLTLDQKGRFHSPVVPNDGKVVFRTVIAGEEKYTVRVLRRGK